MGRFHENLWVGRSPQHESHLQAGATTPFCFDGIDGTRKYSLSIGPSFFLLWTVDTILEHSQVLRQEPPALEPSVRAGV
jgi:hypothetical protein